MNATLREMVTRLGQTSGPDLIQVILTHSIFEKINRTKREQIKSGS